MALLYITEYASGSMVNGVLHTAGVLGTQSVEIGDDSMASKPFSLRTDLIEINAEAACSIAVGKDPVAVATARRISAGETRIYGVTPNMKIAVIGNV
jgi:hypothetical protein